ncbi:aminoglycoside N(3)-acetyltransferase [Micromonospora costi]|uniref:Aminoglycoside N(3)-acetyltransferase n=1 Tax=Micromonospora costi TaxID=1530042 RepID=A0A3A9ZQH7_9ACTN|nr:AAC(3) family N-acetyltransferase [Micromonospora costi]RKN50204.1 aminoglycoside N(3)-acetyltransferase [Micromonospora costi]
MTAPPPVGRAEIAAGLRAVGLAAGATVLVHASLSRVGPVVGGPATVLAALRDVLGDTGTLVVPTQTAGNSITSPAFRAATAGMTADQAARVEAAIAPFDRERSPSEGMGALAEHVRRQPDAVRSGHPQTSFTALGPEAARLTAVHDLDCHLGERSPLGALYAADALVLLLGVGYTACTAFHLAEYRLTHPAAERAYRCYVRDDGGRRVRRDFLALDLDDSDFPRIGAALDSEPSVARGRVGNAVCRAVPMRAAVDFAGRWMTHHRGDDAGPRGVCRCRYCGAMQVSPSDGSGR